MSTITALNAEGHTTALAHFNYINPLPKNTAEVIGNYKNVVVCELNSGQFATYLRSQVPGEYIQYNKIEAQPFTVGELVSFIKSI